MSSIFFLPSFSPTINTDIIFSKIFVRVYNWYGFRVIWDEQLMREISPKTLPKNMIVGVKNNTDFKCRVPWTTNQTGRIPTWIRFFIKHNFVISICCDKRILPTFSKIFIMTDKMCLVFRGLKFRRTRFISMDLFLEFKVLCFEFLKLFCSWFYALFNVDIIYKYKSWFVYFLTTTELCVVIVPQMFSSILSILFFFFLTFKNQKVLLHNKSFFFFSL